MSRMLTTARSGLVVIELAVPSYLDQRTYEGLRTWDFAFLMCLGADGEPYACADPAGNPQLTLPGRQEQPPSGLDTWMRRLLDRSQGSPPGQPLIHVLKHPATAGLL